MKLVESVSMIAIGCVVAGAVFWAVSDTDNGVEGNVNEAEAPRTAKETVSAEQQIAQNTGAQSELKSEPNSEPNADEQSEGRGAADRIHSIISRSEDIIDSEEVLTPEQEQVVAFFQRVARDRNAEAVQDETAPLNFDNLTINKLDVRYYYTTRDTFADLDIDALLAQQKELVQTNICTQPAIKTLIQDYGITYNYRFISQDYRFIGEVSGDVSLCAS